MSTDDELLGPGRLRTLSPFLAPGECKVFHDFLKIGHGPSSIFVDELRTLACRFVGDGHSVKLRTVCLLVADLCAQRWRARVEEDRTTLELVGIARRGTIGGVNARVRSALQSVPMHLRLARSGAAKIPSSGVTDVRASLYGDFESGYTAERTTA